MPKETPFWKRVHKPDGFIPVDEAADPHGLTPEKVVELKEELEDPHLTEGRREEILKLLGGEAEGKEAA